MNQKLSVSEHVRYWKVYNYTIQSSSTVEIYMCTNVVRGIAHRALFTNPYTPSRHLLAATLSIAH